MVNLFSVLLFSGRHESPQQIVRQAGVETENMNLGFPIARPSGLGSSFPLKLRRVPLSLKVHSGHEKSLASLLSSLFHLVHKWVSKSGTHRNKHVFAPFWLTQNANKGMNRTFIHPTVRLGKLSFSCSGIFLGCINACYPIR